MNKACAPPRSYASASATADSMTLPKSPCQRGEPGREQMDDADQDFAMRFKQFFHGSILRCRPRPFPTATF